MGFTANTVLTAAALNTFDPSTKITNAAGSAAAPSYTFNGDSNTGFFSDGNVGYTSWSGNGTEGGRLYSTGVRAVDGSASAPTYSFTSDTNTGMYARAADEIGFTTGGAERVRVGSFGIRGDDAGDVYNFDAFKGNNGSASAPTFSFDDDTNTGMYRYGADSLGFACGGGAAVRISSSDDLYVNGDYIAFNSISSVDDSIRVNGDQFQFRTGGVDRAHLTSAGYLEVSGRRYYFGINSNDYILHDDSANEFDFVHDGSTLAHLGASLNLITSGQTLVSLSPPTGTGNDAEWASIFGTYFLRRNSSTAAEKENITADLGTHLTADMIDSVVPKMWNRTNAPGFPEIGPIAEDMDAISPFLGRKGSDADGDEILTGIDRNAYLSLLVLAVKDLRTRVATLEAA